jgi:hypothetical protein
VSAVTWIQTREPRVPKDLENPCPVTCRHHSPSPLFRTHRLPAVLCQEFISQGRSLNSHSAMKVVYISIKWKNYAVLPPGSVVGRPHTGRPRLGQLSGPLSLSGVQSLQKTTSQFTAAHNARTGLAQEHVVTPDGLITWQSFRLSGPMARPVNISEVVCPN